MTTKSRGVAFILCLLLGGLGVHRFYVGKLGTGIIMLLLSLTGYGLVISLPWALIDLIVIGVGSFSTKDGVVIKNW